MLDGLNPHTCLVTIENYEKSRGGAQLLRYDLVEYGCSGETRYEIDRRTFDDMNDDVPGLTGYFVSIDTINRTLAQVNRTLALHRDCPCR